VSPFLSGLLLRWQPGALGPAPFRRLPADLTAGVAAALTGMRRADEAAATALSLHLNQPPRHFACWSCGDVAADGSTLSAPAGHHDELSGGPDIERATGTAQVLEPLCCETPVVVHGCGRPIVAAHLAFRRDQAAVDRDPLFVHPIRPGRAPSSVLREAVIRVCGRLGLDPS
jgi:hypothetical protein